MPDATLTYSGHHELLLLLKCSSRHKLSDVVNILFVGCMYKCVLGSPSSTMRICLRALPEQSSTIDEQQRSTAQKCTILLNMFLHKQTGGHWQTQPVLTHTHIAQSHAALLRSFSTETQYVHNPDSHCTEPHSLGTDSYSTSIWYA